MFILLLAVVEGFSKCLTGYHIWPEGKTIKENSIFVVEGYGSNPAFILGLGSTHKIYLKSGRQKVNLKVEETIVGQFNIAQAILKPENKLKVGVKYELVIENFPFLEELNRYNDSTEKYEKIEWLVEGRKDTVAPIWTMTPKFKNDSSERYGCGPAVNAFFTFSATDISEILIKTVVKNISTGIETTYYLEPDSNIINVGHGMCSGAFTFYNSDDFEVEFSLFDASGNITSWTGDKIKFKRPT